MDWFDELAGQFYHDNDSIGRKDVRRLIREVKKQREEIEMLRKKLSRCRELAIIITERE